MENYSQTLWYMLQSYYFCWTAVKSNSATSRAKLSATIKEIMEALTAREQKLSNQITEMEKV